MAQFDSQLQFGCVDGWIGSLLHQSAFPIGVLAYECDVSEKLAVNTSPGKCQKSRNILKINEKIWKYAETENNLKT